MLIVQAILEPQNIVGAIVVLALAALVGLVFYSLLRSERMERERLVNRAALLNKARTRLPELVSILAKSPNDEKAQIELRQIAQAFPEFAAEIYARSLDAVEQTNGSASTKRFALEMGRISYGVLRPGGVPTTYDEQAIRNDISARTDAM